ncbi:dipeptidase [Streptomyces iranensis]|uniref:Membrane dipeptidase n=1 Tax=Streptomyces iranensis TaxID=576784 RepID=A0A060ZD59_9ACTN|nr:membrane dipeptidase [Streptomyces iranensis]MBP2066386.1 membrane dipeptidase [Streptomyces iranensis]CDR02774.1 peptidase M19 renal dipeptidase [Streptomyces iranensis]
MATKRYTGYRSFSYLEAGKDYTEFTPSADVDRLPEHDLGLTADEQARAERLLTDNIAVSLHDHPVRLPQRAKTELLQWNREARLAYGYEGLSRSGLDAVFDNLGWGACESRNGWKWDDVITDLGMRWCDFAHQDYVIRAESVADIRRAHAEGQLAVVAGLEGAALIENEIDRLDVLHGLGIRQIGIAYSDANSLGSGLREESDGGLTSLGRRAVRRMNQLGIAIDLSHAGDRTALEVIEASDKPVLITHAGARGLWNTARMKPDEVIRACAATGGMIGIEAAPYTTVSPQHRRHTIESVMDHFRYCVDLVGIEHVGFGPDTFFGDHLDLHHVMSHKWGVADTIRSGPEFETIESVAGLENPGECFRNITRWLVKHGYSDKDISAVIGGNALRVLEKIW